MSIARTTDPKTSHDASKNKRDVRAEILAAFRKRPVKGWTDFELEPYIIDRTGVSPQRVRTVRAALTEPFPELPIDPEQPIRPARGVTRHTPRGHAAQVFRLA